MPGGWVVPPPQQGRGGKGGELVPPSWQTEPEPSFAPDSKLESAIKRDSSPVPRLSGRSFS
eukprot:scaffold71631_cov35-Tisochrysis_lutea.AAC.4